MAGVGGSLAECVGGLGMAGLNLGGMWLDVGVWAMETAGVYCGLGLRKAEAISLKLVARSWVS